MGGAEGDLSKLLMKAVRDNRELTESVKVLVNKGADINMVSGAMDYPYVNDSVLIIAAQNNYMEIVQILVGKGAKHDVKCMSRSWNLGKTPLIFAAMYGKLDIVKTLITKGADVNVKDLAGNSALMMAAKNGHETVTEFLLSKAANVNYVNDDGYTALIYATESGQGHIVEQLKAKGAYMVTLTCTLSPTCSPLSSLTPSKDCEGFIVTTILREVTKPPLETKQPNWKETKSDLYLIIF